MTPQAKAVWRHYYKKLKKQTRGGKLGKALDGYMPGDRNAGKLGLLYRGTGRHEVEKLAQGRFKSSWTSPGIFRGSPDRKATWVASSPQYAGTYAVPAAQSRIVALTPAVLKRRDRRVSARMGETTMTAPIRGGIGQKEVRGLLKGEAFSPQRWNTRGIKKWKPVPLGEIQRKEFSVHELATITRLRDRVAFVKSLRRQLEKKAKAGDSSHTLTGIRGVFAPNTKRYGGMTDRALPRAVKVDGQPAILHYRGTGTNTPELLKRPVLETGKWGATRPEGEPSRRARPSQWQSKFADKKTVARPGAHYQNTNVSKAAYYHAHGSEHPTGLISTSVGKKVASNWAVSQGEKAGVLGVYATKARDLLRKKRKAAMVSNWTSEREIAQATGGNMIARRRLKVVPSPEGQWDLRRFSRIDRQRVEMSQPIGYEAGVPLTGRIARDRWVKKLRDEDLDRRDANLGRAGAAGAIAGALFPSRKLGLYKRMGIGAVAGTAGVLGVRQATKGSRDAYGERSRGAKRAESVPAVAALTGAGLLAAKRLGVLKKLKFEGKGQQLFFSVRELAQVSGRLVELSRWREVLRAGGDSAKKITSRMRLSKTRPHLLQPDVWTKGRGTTVSEMLKFIPEQVRVDRPYPQWAAQISKNARINDIQVSGVQGLGSSALALKTKGDQTLKIQTLPFSRNKFDIATSEIGTVQVPKHHKAPDGKLHIGMQPTASVNSHDNYVPAMLYKSRMKKQGFSPGEFKTENFGFVRGKMKYIDADGSFRPPWRWRETRLNPAKPTESSEFGFRIDRQRVEFGLKASDFSRIDQFAEKKEKGLNPYVGATASGAISGAGLGFIPTILRRGSTLKGALKAGALGGLASGAIVGGGALIGSRILGQPREDEGSAFTKRAAIGGTIAGAGAGLAGGILLRKTRGGAKLLVGASKNWRPAQWLRKGPVVGSAAIGAVAGAGYGGATGADEGQQVDSFRHLRKDLRKDVKRMHGLSSRHEFENVTIKQKRDWLSKARDTAQLAGGLGLLGLTGYAGLKLHGVAKIAQRQIPRVSHAIQKEAPSLARYTKATLRSIRKASAQVSQSSRDLPIKIEGVRDVIDQGMLGRGGIRAAFGKRRELSMFEEKRSIIPAAVLTGAGIAGATAGTIIGLRGGRAVVRAVKRNEKAARQQAVRIEKAIKGTVRSVGTVAGRATQTQQALQNSTRVYADVGKVYRESKGGLYNVLHPINTLRETRRAFRAGLKGRDYYRTKTRPEWAMEAGGVPHVELEKPFHGYNKKRHAKTGGLNDGFRKKYNSEHGSNLQRPVTTEPSKLKPGSKAAKRRASFCARMGGMQGPTSKEGQLTPKGAALKRWNCAAKEELIEMNMNKPRAVSWGDYKHGRAGFEKDLRQLLAKNRTRTGSTAEMRSMRQTPAMKQLLKKENARGSLGQKLRTLMKVLPFEARRRTVEFQQQLAPRELTPEQRQVRNTLLVTGAVVVPAAAAGYLAHRSFREADRKYGDMLNRTGMRPSDVYAGSRRSNRVLALPAPAATRGDVPRKIKEAYSTGTSWGVRTIDNTGKPSAKLRSRLAQTGRTSVRQGAGVNVLPLDYARSRYGVQNRKVIVPPPGPRATEAMKLRADRNMARKPIGQKRDPKMKPVIARGKRLQAIGGDTKNWSRGERKVARATLAVLRKRYRFVSRQAVTELDIYARNKKTGRASGFWDYTRGESLVGRDKKAVDVTLPAFIGAAQREATTGWRYARRAGGLAQDLGEVASGQKTKKREWEKGWFRNAAAVGGIGAGLLAHGLIYRSGKINPRAPRWAKTYTRTVDNVGQSINQTRSSLMKQVNRSVGLSARLRLKQISLDYDAAMVGWDVRDPRGRSARVFAPGARPRYRRQADWHETKEGQRKVLIGAGMLGALATGAGGILVGRRIGQVKTLVKRRGIYSGYQKSQKSKQVIIPFPTAS